MKIVFVLGSYLPKCSAVGNCVKNLVDVLQDEHEVTVLCHARNRREPGCERIGNHDVVRVHTWTQDARADVEAMPASARRSVALLILRCLRAASVASPSGSIQFSIVHAYGEALESLGFEPDLLVPTCLPFEAVLACARYAEVRPSVRFAPFLFDQFADSKTINRPAFLGRVKRGANLRLERKVFRRADGVLNITWDDHVRDCLPDMAGKFVHVEHPLLVRSELDLKGSGVCDLVYAGALDPEVRNPAFALDVLVRVLDGTGLGCARFYVPGYEKFITFFDAVDANVAKLLPPVPSNDVPRVLSGAEWLLSIGNTTSTQKVSKVYEYMAYGKPIVHIASRMGDETSAELERYPLSCCLYEGDGVEACAEKLVRFLERTRGAVVGFDEVAGIFSNELPSSVADALIAAGGGSSMIFTGAFTAKVRPNYLLALMAEMGSAVCVDVKTADVWVDRLNAEPVFRNASSEVGPWVGAADLPALYEAHDALLSIAEKDGRQMSSKIFSYMGTGKPIVHIYYAEDDVNVRYLQDYPLSLCVRADDTIISENARLIRLFLIWSRGRRLPSDKVRELFGECTPEWVAEKVLMCGF